MRKLESCYFLGVVFVICVLTAVVALMSRSSGVDGLISDGRTSAGDHSGLGGKEYPLRLVEAPVTDEPIPAVLTNNRSFAERSRDRSWPLDARRYAFLPMGGILHDDLVPMAFVDHNSSSGVLDWDCAAYTYNGHKGVDVALRSFAEQMIGVPVFAALDGTIVALHDGEDDMNTKRDSKPGNYVVIDHGNGHLTAYYHLKKWSITASVGQEVRAGEQIGHVGSSGISNGPHLHFETRFKQDDGAWVVHDPYAGECRPGVSGWVNQPSQERSVYLWDFGVTDRDMSTILGSPYPFPGGGQIALTESHVYFWAKIRNLPAYTTWRVQMQRPDGIVAFDSGLRRFRNRAFSRGIWRWWQWTIPEEQAVSGTWHILLDLNGSRAIRAPFEVHRNRASFVNRAPEPIAVIFDPLEPTVDDAIFCQIGTDLLLDDPDYDIVRYEYLWTVNGEEVRRVTSAALSDALPQYTALGGDSVTCTVTPSDGIETGEPASVAIIVNHDSDIVSR